MTDLEWHTQLKSAQAGEATAYQALFDELEPRLYAYVMSRLHHEAEAADVVQETLIAFFQGLPNFVYTTTPQLYQYVFTIVKRQLARSYTKSARTGETLNEEIATPASLRTYESTVSRHDIVSALKTLDEVAREIVVLHHWSRFTFGEIATLLNMEEGAVRTRHHRAKQQLAAKLK